jgi:hypothetical protein
MWKTEIKAIFSPGETERAISMIYLKLGYPVYPCFMKEF